MPDVYSPLLNQLIEAFQCLPGVGSKTAQRMVFHLLDKDREGGGRLAATLDRAVRAIRNCERCRMLTEEPVCRFCGNEKRDRSQLCVVESPADLLAIEQSGAYRGSYFVLMGHLSPIDGIGPAELGLELLERFSLPQNRQTGSSVNMRQRSQLRIARTARSSVAANRPALERERAHARRARGDRGGPECQSHPSGVRCYARARQHSLE